MGRVVHADDQPDRHGDQYRQADPPGDDIQAPAEGHQVVRSHRVDAGAARTRR